MIKTFFVLLLLSTNAFACWNMNAILSVGSNQVKIDQKVNHDQTYSFSQHKYIYNVKVLSNHQKPTNAPEVKGGHFVSIEVVEKIGMTLKPITTAQVMVQTGHEAMLTQKDRKTNQLTKLKITLTEI